MFQMNGTGQNTYKQTHLVRVSGAQWILFYG